MLFPRVFSFGPTSEDSRESLGSRGDLRVQGAVDREMLLGAEGQGRLVLYACRTAQPWRYSLRDDTFLSFMESAIAQMSCRYSDKEDLFSRRDLLTSLMKSIAIKMKTWHLSGILFI